METCIDQTNTSHLLPPELGGRSVSWFVDVGRGPTVSLGRHHGSSGGERAVSTGRVLRKLAGRSEGKQFTWDEQDRASCPPLRFRARAEQERKESHQSGHDAGGETEACLMPQGSRFRVQVRSGWTVIQRQ